MSGQWWIEDRTELPEGNYELPEHTVAGTLNDADTDKWSLDTIGSVSGQSLYDRWEGKEKSLGPFTIWGLNADQQSLSLLNCYTTQARLLFGSPLEGAERWQVGTIVNGTGIWVNPDTCVDQVRIEYDDLAAWAWDRHERKVEPEFTDEGVILTISLIPIIEEVHTNDHLVRLSWGKQAPITDAPFQVNPAASLTISDRLTIADVAKKWAYPLGRLLSLLTLSQCSVTSVEARIANDQEGHKKKYVNLRLPQPNPRATEVEPRLGPIGRQLDMLATRTVLEEKGVDLTSLLSAFLGLEAEPKLCDALRHFLDSQACAESGELDEALRCLFNALDNLHDAQFESTVDDDHGLRAAIKELVARTPREHRDEVSRRLHVSRQKSIRQKLHDLVEHSGEAASRVLDLRPELIADAVQARNQIAHTNPRTASRWKRHFVLIDLQWLMRHAFLQLLGVKPPSCDSIFRQTGHPFSQHVGHQ